MYNSCKSNANSQDTKSSNTPIEDAKSIHKRIITLDTLCDISIKNFTDSINYSQNLNSQVNLPKMIAGNLDVAWFVVYTEQDTLSNTGFKKGICYCYIKI